MKYFPLDLGRSLAQARAHDPDDDLCRRRGFLLFGMLHGVTSAFDVVVGAMSDDASCARRAEWACMESCRSRTWRASRASRASRTSVSGNFFARLLSGTDEHSRLRARSTWTAWTRRITSSIVPDGADGGDAPYADGRDHRYGSSSSRCGWKIGDRVTLTIADLDAQRRRERMAVRHRRSLHAGRQRVSDNDELLDQLRVLRRGARLRQRHGHALLRDHRRCDAVRPR